MNFYSRRLQLNPAKTELIWFGSKASSKKTVHLDLNLYIGADVIKPVGVVRDLGVFIDAELSMDQHVKTVVRSCFFHLRRLKSIRRILGKEVTLGLVSAFVTSRLDYCNSSRRTSSGVNRSTSTSPERRRQTCRWSFRYKTPKLKLKFRERAFSYAGPKAWNSLPSNLQEPMNTDTFKKQLKTHLFKLAYE